MLSYPLMRLELTYSLEYWYPSNCFDPKIAKKLTDYDKHELLNNFKSSHNFVVPA